MKTKFSEDEIQILYLPERIPAEEVAKKIRLPIKANFSERIDLDLTPYLKLPISLIGKPGVISIFIIAPTQSGKTVFLQVFVADAILQDPATLMYVLPDETSGKKALNDKVIEMIKNTPELFAHTTGIKNI